MAQADDLMKLVGGGGAPAGAPAPATPGTQAPVGSPMSNPQQNEGAQAQATISITMALDLLEKALPAFGSESEEGGAIIESITKLTRKFGAKRKQSEGMIPAELKMLMEQTGMKSPEQTAATGGGGQPGAAPMQMAA